jgi:ankyrin repeat protein
MDKDNLATRLPDGLEKKLMAAASLGAVDDVRSLLKEGVDVNLRTEARATALHYAAYYGQNDMIRFLVSQGADVAATDNDGATPLTYARALEHSTTAQILRDAADRARQGYTGRVTGERKDKGPPQVGG